MNKKIFKTFILSFVMFFSMFFIDIIDASAADTCSCWYYTEHDIETPIMGGVEAAPSNGNTELSKKTFLIEMKYSANSADVTYSCSATTESTQNLNPLDFRKTCGDSDNRIKRGNPFNVDSAAIARNNCSESACNGAKIKLWCGTDVVTDGYSNTALCVDGVRDFKSITEQQAEAIRNADNAAQESDKQGVSDRSDESTAAQIEKIKNWGKNAKKTKYSSDYDSSCDVIGEDVLMFLNNFFILIEVIGIVLLVVLSVVEFIKVITGSEEDGLKAAFKNTIRRVIIIIILLLLPMLITWILNVINDSNYLKDVKGDVVIGSNGNPICKK